MRVHDDQVPLKRKMCCNRSSVDGLRVPYGDLMGDDAALDTFRKTRKDAYRIGRAIRECCNQNKMSKSAFAAWKASLYAPLNPGKPLSEVLG